MTPKSALIVQVDRKQLLEKTCAIVMDSSLTEEVVLMMINEVVEQAKMLVPFIFDVV